MATPASDGGVPPLRVASFNIRTSHAFDGSNSWPFRRRATAAALAGLAADVAGLQEVHRGAGRFLVRSLGDVAAVGAGRTDGRRGERCLTVYRPERLHLLRWTTRWFADDPGRPGGRLPGAGFPRVATLADFVDRRSGRRLAVANVHLDEHRGENRLAATRLLASWLAPHVPWIVVGDFNAGQSSAALRPLLDVGLRPVLAADAGGTAHRFTGRADGPRLDHILVRGPWEVLHGGVVRTRPGGRLPSDHWPVVADLRLTDGDAGGGGEGDAGGEGAGGEGDAGSISHNRASTWRTIAKWTGGGPSWVRTCRTLEVRVS